MRPVAPDHLYICMNACVYNINSVIDKGFKLWNGKNKLKINPNCILHGDTKFDVI